MAAQQKKAFTVTKQNPITPVKNQYRSGTCWDYATLGFFESEILRRTGKTHDLCEMFVLRRGLSTSYTFYVFYTAINIPLKYAQAGRGTVFWLFRKS